MLKLAPPSIPSPQLDPIDTWLGQLFDDDRIDDTCAQLAQPTAPETIASTNRTEARKTIADCDRKLAKYREALETGTDPAVVGKWIEEVELVRSVAQTNLKASTATTGTSAAGIAATVQECKGLVEILRQADPQDRKVVYRELNLSVTYHDDGRIDVSAGPEPCTNECVGGALLTQSTRTPWSAELTAA